MSTISAILQAPPDNFSTTLSADITASGLTVALNDITGLGSEGVGVIFKKNSDGTPDTTTIEFVHWTGTGVNSVTLTDTGDRGISGSYNGAQSHSNGDTFEVWVHSKYYPRTALANLVNTTTGALDTTKVVDLTTAQTLTNKTLTTPVVASLYQDAGKTKLMTMPNTASDTLAAIAATQTLTNKTIAMGGYLQPAVSALTDGANIATNAALGNYFTVVLAGNRTMDAPTNPTNGQVIIYELKQDATGTRTITWSSAAGGFSFGASAAPTLSTAAAKIDLVAFRYSTTAAKWLYMGSQLGF